MILRTAKGILIQDGKLKLMQSSEEGLTYRYPLSHTSMLIYEQTRITLLYVGYPTCCTILAITLHECCRIEAYPPLEYEFVGSRDRRGMA